jgi:hypothetical protein
VVREDGSCGAYTGRNSRTRSLSTVIPCSQPIRSAITVAGKGRAFRSLGPLMARQGGQHVLYGSALALTAAIRTWSNDTGTPVPQLARTAIR